MANNKKEVNKKASFNYKYVLLVLLLSLFIPSFYKVNKKVTEKVQDIIEEVIYIPSSPEIETTDEGWTTETVVKIKKDAASRHGISYYEYCVREDEDFSKCEWQKTDTKNIIISKTGVYNVVFRAVNSKNKHSKLSNVIKVYIDNEAPEITSDSLKLKIYDTKVEASINADDKNSGLGEITYSLDGTNFELLDPINGITGLKPNTEYDLYIKVSDKLGNSKVLKKTLKTPKKGALPIDEAGNEITDDPSVNPGTGESGSGNEPEEVDSFIPEISLSDVPMSINFGDSYVLPTSYKFGKSGGNVTCSVDDMAITNTSQLSIGNQEVICTAQGNNGISTKVSKYILVGYQPAENETWDGYITLNLYYPPSSTNRMWRLNVKNTIRDGENDSEWTNYTGPITVRMEDVGNVYIKYDLNDKEIIDTKGDALVDIRPNSYRVYSFDKTKVSITFDKDAETKEYRINGGDWVTYTEPFFAGANSLIEAKVTKIVNTYDKFGDLIKTKTVTNTDSVYIHERDWTVNQIFGKVDINITATPSSVVDDEKSTIIISYQSDSENRVYRINGGAWIPYTEPFEVGKNTIIEAYATATREVTTADGSKYSGNTDGSARVKVYDGADYHDYSVSLSGNTNIDVTETSKIYVSTDHNLQALSYSINGGEYVSTQARSYAYYQIATLGVNDTITVKAEYLANDNKTKIAYDSLTVGENKNGLRLSITAPDNVIDNANAPITIYANYPTKTLEYRVNGGEWTTYTGSFNVLNNSLVEARATKENSDGSEQSVFKSKYVKTTPLSVSVSSSNNYVYVDDTATITISSNYPNAILYYSYDDVTYNRYYQPLSVIGGTTVYGKAEYRDSNNDLQVAKSSTKVVLVNNLTGPSITSSNTSTTTKPVTITLNTEFDGDIYYSIDNGPWIAYQNPFEISKNSLVKAYYVRESDGLTSKTTSYRITNIRNEDLPTITINANPNDPNTLVDEVTISISAHDYDVLEYSLDNVYFQNYTGSFKISDNHTIYARAKNYNGWSYSQLVVNNVNPIKPVTLASNITINPTKQNSNNSVNEVIATLTYDERATSRLYKLGSDDDWHEYTEPLHITRNTTVYLYESDDLRGTGSNSKRIDFLPEGIVDPIITSSPDASVPANEVSISISYDVIATVKKYRIDNGPLQDYEGPITIDTNNTTIYAYSEDINGQVADASYVVSNITTVTNLVLDQGSYYLIKLNYPTTGKIVDKEYKMENGDWKPYPNDGILFIKPEYQDQVLNNNGVLIIDIVDENGDTINFNGDHYVIDDNISQIVTSISLRWNTLPPDTPTFDAEETGWTSSFELTINYPANMLQKQYRIVYPDGTNTGWLSYDKPLSIDDNVTVYARCQDEIEVWSDVGEFNVTNIDKTKPTISNTELTQAGTNFLTFNVTAADNESGVKYYYYSTDGENYSVAMNKNIKFNGLTANTEYTLYFYVQDNVGNRSEVVTATGMTSQIAKPIVTFEPSADTWSTSKRVLISHEDTLMTLYYSKDNGNTWEEYTEEVVLTENGSIIAKASDGTNERLSDTYTITKIDITAPSVTNIAYAGRSSRLIVNAEASDSESGIDHFLYSLDGVTYTEDDESYSFTNLKANTDYTIYVKAVNKAGLESEARSTSAHTNDIAEISYSVTDADVWAYTKTVTINYPSEEDGSYTNQYSLNGGNTWVNYTEPILIETENTSIVARVLDGTQNTKIASTLQIAKIDRTEPTISLDGVPSEFETGSSVTIPTSYTIDNNKSGGTVVCTSSKSGEFTKVSDLEGGYQTITCTVTTGAGRTATASKEVTVVKIESRRGESLLKILEDNTLENDHYYSFIVEADEETVTYSVHMIVLDGNQTITEDTRYGDLSDCASGTTEDLMAKRMVIVKVNGDYTINEDITVGPVYHDQYGGPKGFMLYVTGKLTNNGIIDQNHGAYAQGENVYLWKNELTNDYEMIPAVGAAATAAGSTVSKRALGGGGNYNKGGNGGSATSYSGGTGGSTSAANNFGGTGGNGKTSNVSYSGGTGNPGGIGYKAGANGTGGLLIIYADQFTNQGNIVANGTNAINQYPGSSGGGSINIFTNQATNINTLSVVIDDYYNSMFGTQSVLGGKYETSNVAITNGGAGTANIGEIRNGQYYDLKDIIRQDIDTYSETITKTGDSIINILNNNSNLSTGYWNFKVVTDDETVNYPVHLIILDGDQTITEDTRYGDLADCASGTTEDRMAKAMVIVKVNGNYTINEGVIVGPTYHDQYGGPKGFMLYITGKFTNNGTIDQNHGAYAQGDNVYLWYDSSTGDYEVVPAVGALKGAAGSTVSDRALGGGGNHYQTATGGTATSYSGGTGGSNLAGNNFGGQGGMGSSTSAWNAGGTGNPGGTASNGSRPGTNGTGGLLIIYANEFDNQSRLNARGTTAVNEYVGSSGGGSINIFYSTLINEGTTDVTVNKYSTTANSAKCLAGEGTVSFTQITLVSPKLMMSAPKSAPKVIVETPTISIDNTDYAESKTISISYPKGYTSEYSLDLGKTWIEYQGEITVEENITILARSLDENNNIVSTSSFTVNRIDRETPSIELNLEDEITVGSDITLPTGYTSTKSGVTYECKYNDNIISNINELSVGDYEITCDIENGLGKKNTISKMIKIIEEISKEEVSEVNS